MSWQDARAKGGKTGLVIDSGESSNTMAKVPKQYSVTLKLQVAQFAVANSNAEAERKFGINESCIRRWRKEITHLKMLNRATAATSAKQQQTTAKNSTGGSESLKINTDKKPSKVVSLPGKTWQRGRKSKAFKLAARGRGFGRGVERVTVETSSRGRGRGVGGIGRVGGFGRGRGLRGGTGPSGRLVGRLGKALKEGKKEIKDEKGKPDGDEWMSFVEDEEDVKKEDEDEDEDENDDEDDNEEENSGNDDSPSDLNSANEGSESTDTKKKVLELMSKQFNSGNIKEVSSMPQVKHNRVSKLSRKRKSDAIDSPDDAEEGNKTLITPPNSTTNALKKVRKESLDKVSPIPGFYSRGRKSLVGQKLSIDKDLKEECENQLEDEENIKTEENDEEDSKSVNGTESRGRKSTRGRDSDNESGSESPATRSQRKAESASPATNTRRQSKDEDRAESSQRGRGRGSLIGTRGMRKRGRGRAKGAARGNAEPSRDMSPVNIVRGRGRGRPLKVRRIPLEGKNNDIEERSNIQGARSSTPIQSKTLTPELKRSKRTGGKKQLTIMETLRLQKEKLDRKLESPPSARKRREELEKKALKEEMAIKKALLIEAKKAFGKDKVNKANYLIFTKTGKVKKKPYKGKRLKKGKKTISLDKGETDSVASESIASEDLELESFEESSSQGIPSDDEETIEDLEEDSESKENEDITEENVLNEKDQQFNKSTIASLSSKKQQSEKKNKEVMKQNDLKDSKDTVDEIHKDTKVENPDTVEDTLEQENEESEDIVESEEPVDEVDIHSEDLADEELEAELDRAEEDIEDDGDENTSGEWEDEEIEEEIGGEEVEDTIVEITETEEKEEIEENREQLQENIESKVFGDDIVNETIADDMIAEDAIAEDSIADGNIDDDNIDDDNIDDDNIEGNDMEDDNIEDDNIEDDNIEDDNIKDDNIEDANIEDDKIEDDDIEDDNIKDDNTEDANVADDNVEDDNVADDNVDDTFADNIIDEKIVNDGDKEDTKITDTKITDTKITVTKITDTKITETKITDTKIADTKITVNKIIDNKITGDKGTGDKVTDYKDTDDKVTVNKATDDKVTDDKVTDNKVTDNKVTDNEVTDNKVTDNKVTDNKVTDNKVTDNKVTDNKVTGNKVTDDKVTDNKVTNSKATDDKVTDDKVTGDKVTDDKVTDDKVTDDKVTDNKVNDSKVTDNKVTGNKVTEDKVKVTEDKVKVTEVKVTEIKVTEDKVTEDKVTEDKVTDSKVTGNKVTEDKVTEDKVTEDIVTDSKVTGNKVTEDKDKVAEDKVTEDKVTEDKVTEDKVTEDKVTEDKVTEDKVNDRKVTGNKVTGNKATGNKVTDNKIANEYITDHEITDDRVLENRITNEDILKGAIADGNVKDNIKSNDKDEMNIAEKNIFEHNKKDVHIEEQEYKKDTNDDNDNDPKSKVTQPTNTDANKEENKDSSIITENEEKGDDKQVSESLVHESTKTEINNELIEDKSNIEESENNTVTSKDNCIQENKNASNPNEESRKKQENIENLNVVNKLMKEKKKISVSTEKIFGSKEKGNSDNLKTLEKNITAETQLKEAAIVEGMDIQPLDETVNYQMKDGIEMVKGMEVDNASTRSEIPSLENKIILSKSRDDESMDIEMNEEYFYETKQDLPVGAVEEKDLNESQQSLSNSETETSCSIATQGHITDAYNEYVGSQLDATASDATSPVNAITPLPTTSPLNTRTPLPLQICEGKSALFKSLGLGSTDEVAQFRSALREKEEAEASRASMDIPSMSRSPFDFQEPEDRDIKSYRPRGRGRGRGRRQSMYKRKLDATDHDTSQLGHHNGSSSESGAGPTAQEQYIMRKSKRLSRHNSPHRTLMPAPPSPDIATGQANPIGTPSAFVADPTLTNILCKCRVKEAPVAENIDNMDEVHCQAIDSYEGRMIGCCNLIASPRYLRVSGKIPFLLLCEIHRQRIRRHNCCPGCGLFCTKGLFLECSWDKNGVRHYYHKLCGLTIGNLVVCPHCGTQEKPKEVYIEFSLKLNRKPVVYVEQHQEKKAVLSARMGWGRNDEQYEDDQAMLSDVEDEVPENEPRLTLSEGRVITAHKLNIGLEKDRLQAAIRTITVGKMINIKASPKTIYWACKQGDMEKLLHVLCLGVNPNSKVKDQGNQTGLHIAAAFGNVAAVHVLLLAGATQDLTDVDLMTPLMVAIQKNQNHVVHYLIQAGASLLAKTQDGMTCLHLAAKCGNKMACKHILDSGRLSRHAVNTQDEGGWTPLVWASENKYINIVKFLLDRGGNPQICDVEQNTALHWGAFSGSTHICSMVLDRGCSLRSMNAHGDTPLHIAARQNHSEAVVLLLARGANLDVINSKGQTPLNSAVPESEVYYQIDLNAKLLGMMDKLGVRTEKILSSDIAAGKEQVPIPVVNGVDNGDLPTDYLYISENCEASNVNINRTITSLKYCSCEDGCNSDHCACGELHFQCWFDPEGRLLPEFNYNDPPMLFECNRACKCNKLSCYNRVVQHGISAHMQLFKTKGKGWGVRALKTITKGSYVCEYVGEIITDFEAEQRQDDSYLFDLDNRDSETFCIDARNYGNVARFINHLCEPNLSPVKVFIDHQDLAFPRIALFANRDIEADEELGFDYGEKFWVIKYKQFTCTCGLARCKYSSTTIYDTLEKYNRKMQEYES